MHDSQTVTIFERFFHACINLFIRTHLSTGITLLAILLRDLGQIAHSEARLVRIQISVEFMLSHGPTVTAVGRGFLHLGADHVNDGADERDQVEASGEEFRVKGIPAVFFVDSAHTDVIEPILDHLREHGESQ